MFILSLFEKKKKKARYSTVYIDFINDIIIIVKKKLKKNVTLEQIDIEDKTFLHKSHKSHDLGKFHLKLIIKSGHSRFPVIGEDRDDVLGILLAKDLPTSPSLV